MIVIENYNVLKTPLQLLTHIVFVGFLPLFDVVTDLTVLATLIRDELNLYICLSVVSLTAPTLGRIVFMLKDKSRCPRKNKKLGVLLQVLQFHSLHNVWADLGNGKKGEASSLTMLLELGGESGLQTLIVLASMLSPERWPTWSLKEMHWTNVVVVLSAFTSIVSIGYGAVMVTIEEAYRDQRPGVATLYRSAGKKIVFALYFLSSAILSLCAHAVFFAAFRWWWVLCFSTLAIIVRPLAARMCGLIDEEMVSIKHSSVGGLLLGPLWLFVDFPYGLVKDDNGKDWARGTLMCGVLSVLESWILLIIQVYSDKSMLGNPDKYDKPPKISFQDNHFYPLIGVITLIKCFAGYFVYTHWVQAQRAAIVQQIAEDRAKQMEETKEREEAAKQREEAASRQRQSQIEMTMDDENVSAQKRRYTAAQETLQLIQEAEETGDSNPSTNTVKEELQKEMELAKEAMEAAQQWANRNELGVAEAKARKAEMRYKEAEETLHAIEFAEEGEAEPDIEGSFQSSVSSDMKEEVFKELEDALKNMHEAHSFVRRVSSQSSNRNSHSSNRSSQSSNRRSM